MARASNPGFSTKALDLLIYVGIALLALFFLKDYISDILDKLSQSKTDSLTDQIGLGTNKAAEQASQLRNGINPSGNAWSINLDGTDEAAILSVARDITDFNAVSTAYRTLYGTALTDDLKNELSSSDYAKFIGIVTGTSYESVTYEGGTATPTVITSSDKFIPGTPLKTTGGVGYGSGVNIRSYSDITKIVGTIPNDRYAGEVETTINFTNTALAVKGRYVFLKNMTPTYFNDGVSTRGCIYEELLTKQIK